MTSKGDNVSSWYVLTYIVQTRNGDSTEHRTIYHDLLHFILFLSPYCQVTRISLNPPLSSLSFSLAHTHTHTHLRKDLMMIAYVLSINVTHQLSQYQLMFYLDTFCNPVNSLCITQRFPSLMLFTFLKFHLQEKRDTVCSSRYVYYYLISLQCSQQG